MLLKCVLALLTVGAALGTLVSRAACDALPAGHAIAFSTYADSLIRYDPAYGGGCIPSEANFIDPLSAVGRPDYSGGAYGTGAVSLGSGGVLELYFGGSRIANSGDSRTDLHVVEIGGYTERCFVALRPALPTTPQDLIDLGLRDTNLDGYFEIGRSVSSGEFDLDALFNRPVAQWGVQFDAVQLVDDIDDTPSCTSTVGADIDAVEASQPWVAVLPTTWTTVKALYRD